MNFYQATESSILLIYPSEAWETFGSNMESNILVLDGMITIRRFLILIIDSHRRRWDHNQKSSRTHKQNMVSGRFNSHPFDPRDESLSSINSGISHVQI